MGIKLSDQATAELSRFAALASDGETAADLNFRLPANDFTAAYELESAGLVSFDVDANAYGMMGPTELGKVQIRALILGDNPFSDHAVEPQEQNLDSSLVNGLKSGDVGRQTWAIKEVSKLGDRAKDYIGPLAYVTGDDTYQYRDTGVAAQSAINELARIACLPEVKGSDTQERIFNILHDRMEHSNGKIYWAALLAMRDLGRNGALTSTQLDRLDRQIAEPTNSNIAYNVKILREAVKFGRNE
jgi:hypothetical protein